MEKYFEDARQDEKHVPDLLEAIMRPTDPVKEELRQKLFKINRIRPEIIKIMASTFCISGKSADSRRRPTQPSRPVSFKPITAPRPEKSKNMQGFGPWGAKSMHAY